MNWAVVTTAGVDNRPAPIRKGLWAKPLLPNEPRIHDPVFERALSEQYLLPVLAELEACFLAVRRQLDPELQRLIPMKLGKPYPLGQCLEIAQAVQQRLRTMDESSLSPVAVRGLRALRTFQRAGGSFRQVWGDLRGQFFQNAFQLGCLYVDVSNDTVDPTKPKVEVLLFDQAQFIPIQDFVHFRTIASKYWQDRIYPNYVLPKFAPYCPLIHINPAGRIQLHDTTQYMLAMTNSQAFRPSEDVLSNSTMPQSVFTQICSALAGTPHILTRNPEQGRKLALLQCRQYRDRRWHQQPQRTEQIIAAVKQVNLRLARSHFDTITKGTRMNTIKIDNIDYDLDSFSAEARAQLQSIQFVDQELVRLQAHTAALQTARIAYVNALKAALPVAPNSDIVEF